jgi:hypothetical protein
MNNNNNNILNMNYYRNKENEKKKFKLDFFDSMFNLIIEKIKILASNSETVCIYEIPIFMFGYPNYTMNEISSYLLTKFTIYLNNKDLEEVIFYDPNLLYIKWSL